MSTLLLKKRKRGIIGLMNKLTTSELAGSVSGAIDPGGKEAVGICGSRCPDREAIASVLRGAGISVTEVSCLGTRGGCSSSGDLPEGSYATAMVQEVGSDSRERTVVAVTLDQDLPI